MQEPDLQAFKLWNILGFKLPELLSEAANLLENSQSLKACKCPEDLLSVFGSQCDNIAVMVSVVVVAIAAAAAQ